MRRTSWLASSLISGLAGALSATVLSVAGVAGANADELKIGFVSIERITRESAAAKVAETRLAQEFVKRDKDLQELGAKLKATADKLDKDGPVLTGARPHAPAARAPGDGPRVPAPPA
jgi:outer membrane protein